MKSSWGVRRVAYLDMLDAGDVNQTRVGAEAVNDVEADGQK